MSLPKRILVKTGDTTYDKIFAHFIDEKKYKLTPLQTQIKDRLLAAWTLRLNFHSTEQGVNVYMKKYSLSRAQAFRDISRAERLFGSLSKTTKDGKRAVWAEYVHKYLQLSLESKDLKSVGKALDLLERAYELDKTESVSFNPEKLVDKEVKFSVSKESMKIMTALVASGVVDLNNPPAIEIPHEELE